MLGWAGTGQDTPFTPFPTGSGILNICCIWASPFSLSVRGPRCDDDDDDGETCINEEKERERGLFTRGWVSILGLLRRVGTFSTDKLRPLEGKWCYYFARPVPVQRSPPPHRPSPSIPSLLCSAYLTASLFGRRLKCRRRRRRRRITCTCTLPQRPAEAGEAGTDLPNSHM